jgi:hypothetical protein
MCVYVYISLNNGSEKLWIKTLRKYIFNGVSNDRSSFNFRVKYSLTRLFYKETLQSFKTSVKKLSVDIKLELPSFE